MSEQESSDIKSDTKQDLGQAAEAPICLKGVCRVPVKDCTGVT